MMPVHSIPANAYLQRITIDYPETEEHSVTLQFDLEGKLQIITIYSPDSIADILELNEVLIGGVDVLDAGGEQREGFRQKLLFETDKGEFEIWATKIQVDTRG